MKKKTRTLILPFLLLVVSCNDDDGPSSPSATDCATICISYNDTQTIPADGATKVQIFIERAENADEEYQTGSITVDNGQFENGKKTKSINLSNGFRDTVNVIAGINPQIPMNIEASLGTNTVLASEPLTIELEPLAATDIYENLTGSITDLEADGVSERQLELQINIPVNLRFTAERNVLREFGGEASTSVTDIPLNGRSSVIIVSDQNPGESFIKLEFIEPEMSTVLYEEVISFTTILASPDRINVSAGSVLTVDSTGAVLPITANLSRNTGKVSNGVVVTFYALSDPNDLNSSIGRFSTEQVENNDSEMVSTSFIFENSELLSSGDKIYIVAQAQSASGTISDTWLLTVTSGSG